MNRRLVILIGALALGGCATQPAEDPFHIRTQDPVLPSRPVWDPPLSRKGAKAAKADDFVSQAFASFAPSRDICKK